MRWYNDRPTLLIEKYKFHVQPLLIFIIILSRPTVMILESFYNECSHGHVLSIASCQLIGQNVIVDHRIGTLKHTLNA